MTVIQNEGQGGFQWGYSESSWDDSVTARVNAEGWAEFPALAFGKGTVVVRAKGFSRDKVDWVKDEEEFDVYLEPESRLGGRVLDRGWQARLGGKGHALVGTGRDDERPGRRERRPVHG